LTNGFQIQEKFVETEKKYNKNSLVEVESSASAGIFSAAVSTFHRVNPVRCWWKCRGIGGFSVGPACGAVNRGPWAMIVSTPTPATRGSSDRCACYSEIQLKKCM
jgi:hypothetical protein